MIKNSKYNLITILGPTASGKTGLAAQVASRVKGEIISGDSRQVYRNMDIGTGKDYKDYTVDGIEIPAHLIDIEQPGHHYNVYRFQSDFFQVFQDIRERGKFPILCGGSGLYMESVLKDYQLIHVPPNKELRKDMENKSLEELTDLLKSLKPDLHNTTDMETIRRAVRAIEIEKYTRNHPELKFSFPDIKSLTIGVSLDRDSRRERITQRLKQRLEEGMIEEVQRLLHSGLTPQQLIYYGLEYKYVTLHLTGQLTFQEMFGKLETAIHQFSKRQMTWFRGMEKRGTQIFWIDGSLAFSEKIEKILEMFHQP
ncbi:MAG: tRNA (adenosine(37)-N6)-dimethylallyltransferase MiaA [Mariniphaga sp.]